MMQIGTNESAEQRHKTVNSAGGRDAANQTSLVGHWVRALWKINELKPLLKIKKI